MPFQSKMTLPTFYRGAGHGGMWAWGHGDMRTWGHGDMGTWGHGDMGTWGYGDIGMGMTIDRATQRHYGGYSRGMRSGGLLGATTTVTGIRRRVIGEHASPAPSVMMATPSERKWLPLRSSLNRTGAWLRATQGGVNGGRTEAGLRHTMALSGCYRIRWCPPSAPQVVTSLSPP